MKLVFTVRVATRSYLPILSLFGLLSACAGAERVGVGNIPDAELVTLQSACFSEDCKSAIERTLASYKDASPVTIHLMKVDGNRPVDAEKDSDRYGSNLTGGFTIETGPGLKTVHVKPRFNINTPEERELLGNAPPAFYLLSVDLENETKEVSFKAEPGRRYAVIGLEKWHGVQNVAGSRVSWTPAVIEMDSLSVVVPNGDADWQSYCTVFPSQLVTRPC